MNIEELDEVLKIICESQSRVAGFKMKSHKEACDKLSSLGYIEIDGQTIGGEFEANSYKPTMAGKEFFSKGGFKGEKGRKKEEVDRYKSTNLKAWIAIGIDGE